LATCQIRFAKKKIAIRGTPKIDSQNQEVIMNKEVVMVRDCEDRALKRVLCGIANRVAYVANPAYMPAIESGESMPVGFPLEDVFEFNDGLMARIDADRSQWSAARPYGESPRPVTP
jgi:hypothetical protein